MADARVLMSSALRTVFGVAALLGLFAMHGLAGHGTAHHAEQDIAPMVLVSAADHHSSATGHHGGGESSGHPTGNQPDPGLALAGLCLAVLLTGVVLAVVLGRGFPVRGVQGLRWRAGGRPGRSRRYRDPPCLVTLSIQRC